LWSSALRIVGDAANLNSRFIFGVVRCGALDVQNEPEHKPFTVAPEAWREILARLLDLNLRMAADADGAGAPSGRRGRR
jgi:hypothetical protein